MSLAKTSWIALLLVCAACSGLTQNPPTETPTNTAPPTDIPTLTLTPLPSDTAAPTQTPSPMLTPSSTLTWTPQPTPSTTPSPTLNFIYDNWDFVEAPAGIESMLVTPHLAFVNTNNRNVQNIGTPTPGNNISTLYYLSSNGGTPVEMLQMTAETGDQVYVAPTGNAIAYMRLENTPSTDGLYVVDLTLATPIRGRILATTSLNQRGIPSEPVWSPDGTRLAVALETAYDIDIFTVGRDGATPTNMTRNGSYDFWPTWSPDGRYLSFVSDRAVCPSWIPGEPNTCDGTDTEPPRGGYVYIMDVTTGETRQISQQWVTEPPQWVNPRQIAYASGEPAFGDPARELWIADIFTNETRQLVLDQNDDPFKFAESWSPNGQQVFYQAADDSTTLVLASLDGTEIARVDNLNFTRFGVSAAWSPNGTTIAIGGVGGQCPYGVITITNEFGYVARGNPPPSMCEPTYSPDGSLLAFTGVNPRQDGRIDIYVANANGFGAQNLTANLRGNINLLGWVGG